MYFPSCCTLRHRVVVVDENHDMYNFEKIEANEGKRLCFSAETSANHRPVLSNPRAERYFNFPPTGLLPYWRPRGRSVGKDNGARSQNVQASALSFICSILWHTTYPSQQEDAVPETHRCHSQ